MNKTIVTLLAFLCGGGVGYFVAMKLLEEKYAQIAQEEIDSVKETFSKKISNVTVNVDNSGIVSDNGMTDEEYESRSNRMPLIRNSINDAGETVKSRTSYHDMAKEEMKATLGIGQETDEENEPVVDAAGFYEGDYESTVTVRDMSSVDRTAPYVISSDEFTDEFPHHDKISLYYYTDDDTLADENDEIMEDIDDTVGWDVFKVLDVQTSAWARNERLGIDYEICAVRNSYVRATQGIKVSEALSPRERHLREMKRRNGYDE